MKKLIFSLLLFCFWTTIAFAQTNPNHVKVNGYYRNDGTYVQPHYRTAPNSTNRDNFSTKPNYNPYTRKSGHIQPDNNGTYPTYTYPSTSPSNYNNSYPSSTTKIAETGTTDIYTFSEWTMILPLPNTNNKLHSVFTQISVDKVRNQPENQYSNCCISSNLKT
jgi:hypothetical protein